MHLLQQLVKPTSIHSIKFLVANYQFSFISVSAVVLSGGIDQPRFRADHPFFFYIWDNKTKSALFSGRVTDFDPVETAPEEKKDFR